MTPARKLRTLFGAFSAVIRKRQSFPLALMVLRTKRMLENGK